MLREVTSTGVNEGHRKHTLTTAGFTIALQPLPTLQTEVSESRSETQIRDILVLRKPQRSQSSGRPGR